MPRAMDHTKSSLERAFEMAKSGRCQSVADVRNALKAEGYDARQIEGGVLSKQIRAEIKKARAEM